MHIDTVSTYVYIVHSLECLLFPFSPFAAKITKWRVFAYAVLWSGYFTILFRALVIGLSLPFVSGWSMIKVVGTRRVECQGDCVLARVPVSLQNNTFDLQHALTWVLCLYLAGKFSSTWTWVLRDRMDGSW